jgi:hypothetical protein
MTTSRREAERLKAYHPRMRLRKSAHIPPYLFVKFFSSSFLVDLPSVFLEQFDDHLPFEGDQRDGR